MVVHTRLCRKQLLQYQIDIALLSEYGDPLEI
jgi:hypothetical protein